MKDETDVEVDLPTNMDMNNMYGIEDLIDIDPIFLLLGSLVLLLALVIVIWPVRMLVAGTYRRVWDKVADLHSRRCRWVILCHEKDATNRMQKKEVTDLHEKLQQKSELLKKYTLRLSEEINHKVSADESNVENVSIKTRPMNVAEDYDNMCSDEWLTAKETLDEKVKDMSDHVKIDLLFRIMMSANEKIEDFYTSYWRHLQEIFQKPSSMLSSHKQADIPNDQFDMTKMGLPKALLNSVCDFLRNRDDALKLSHFVEQVLEDITRKFDTESSALIELLKTDPDLQQYIQACLTFCWKMVIQRPQMKFKVAEKYLGETYHEIHWNSVQPSKEHKVAHVYPMLYHGTNLMKKGKVLLISPCTSAEQMDVSDEDL